METLAEIYFLEDLKHFLVPNQERGKRMSMKSIHKSTNSMIKNAMKGKLPSDTDMNAAELKAKGNYFLGAHGQQIAGVGAAYLLYKGIQLLRKKFSKAKNPEEKEKIKKQIEVKKRSIKES